MGRRKSKSSVSVSVSRPHLAKINRIPVARSVNVYRQQNGRLGSSSAHTLSRIAQIEDRIASGSDIALADVQGFDSMETQMDAEPGPSPALREDQEEATEKTPPRRPVKDWLPYRQSYLEEMLRHDGRGTLECFKCGSTGDFRCHDCTFGQNYCQDCLLDRHAYLPLHRIQHWTGTFYEDTTLRNIGLVVPLGHNGAKCPAPSDIQTDFVVVDGSGLHILNVQFCGCHHISGASYPRIQLLRVGWFPSSLHRPRSAFTFDVLDSFHLLTLQGKTSAYDFYTSISHKTDNTGVVKIKTRYPQFLTAIRLWRHLKMLKRAGRGHDPAGVDATKPGSCAVECPACPHPGRNLPPDWANAPANVKWLYRLNLTKDANFRLKNKARGVKNDLPLGDGWAHWVPEGPYQEYIAKYGYQVEPNLCDSELHAVDHANTKFSDGYISTGVGGVLCGRHTLVRKNGLGNLQKGERYANMDFILLFSLIGTVFWQQLLFSYDIVCQWFRNLKKRMAQFPDYMQIPAAQLSNITFVIPKFHIYGHGLACQTKFSLNFLPWMAEMNGEDPERWWAHINPISPSTKEMGPGSRSDTIDDHATAWNWQKIVGFGTALISQFTNALAMREKHQVAHDKLCATFSEEVQHNWEKMVADWNSDPRKKNPYVEPVSCMSMTALRLELAKEEATNAANGHPSPHETSPSSFLQIGLDLEEQQRALLVKAKGKLTTLEQAEVQEKRNVLSRRITAFVELRNLYMPALGELADGSQTSSTIQPEATPLRLPSSLPATSRTIICSSTLIDTECRIRLAQADDSLCELRRLLRVTRGLWQYKFKQIGPSQRVTTRARALINRFNEKTVRCANRYRQAYSALLALDPNGNWKSRLQPLHDDDVKGPGKEDDEAEGTRQLSWIWLVERNGDAASVEEGEVTDSLRCEWAKSKARSARWKEEVILLIEEMRRVIVFLDWKANWWVGQSGLRHDVSNEVSDGLHAYAAKQAHIMRSMAMKFASMWYPELVKNGFAVEWPLQYIPLGTSVTDSMSDDEDD